MSGAQGFSFTPSAEQAAVINRPMEPLRVDAGAGTGKTATLAGRIVYLVEKGEVEPEQVLGITFTNKAAGELADRIRTALGDAARTGPRGRGAHVPRLRRPSPRAVRSVGRRGAGCRGS